MTITTQQLQSVTGKVYSRSSDKVGTIGQVYLDDTSGDPTWATVKTGLFGSSESFVPLQGASVDGDDLYVDFEHDIIKDAPRVDADGSISPQDEDELYAYYGLSGTSGPADPAIDGAAHEVAGRHAQPAGTSVDADRGHDDDSPYDDIATDSEVPSASDDPTSQTVGTDTSGPTTDNAMTRSEERLRVGTATRESGRARLRKYVTTDTVTETVPVRHEEVTLEREPITAENAAAAGSGPAISEEEHEVVLHEEVPVIEKDVVAVERVSLGTTTVTRDAEVSEDVRSENIEMVDPDTTDATEPGTDRR